MTSSDTPALTLSNGISGVVQSGREWIKMFEPKTGKTVATQPAQAAIQQSIHYRVLLNPATAVQSGMANQIVDF